MRKIIFIVLALSLLFACDKDNSGTMIYNITYTSSKSQSMAGIFNQKKSTLDEDSLYSQFGDYITCITPARFIGDIGMIRYYPDIHGWIPIALTLIIDTLPADDPLRYADFSNNAKVTVTPHLMGDFGPNGSLNETPINFVILHIVVNNFYQEAELPVEYTNVNLSQFNDYYVNPQYPFDSGKSGNILNVDYMVFLAKLFNIDLTGVPSEFYFGRTDSTTLNFFETEQIIPALDPVPRQFFANFFFVWSHKYNEWTLYPPLAGETRTINSTIGFDTENLIQIYAGEDNIPYTSDDVFVYAPKYWERIYVDVTTN